MAAPLRIDRIAIHHLLARYGVTPARVQRVAHLGMQVFRIRSPAGELALRIYAAPGPDRVQIESELCWLQAMAQADLHVPAPLADRAGRMLQSLPDPAGSPSTCHAVLLRWLPGRCLTRGLRPGHLGRVGTLMARMHDTARALDTAGRIASKQPAFVPDLQAWAQGRRKPSPHLSARAHQLACEAAIRLRAELAALPRPAPDFGYIHGDAHLWNLLFRDGRAGLIDFSECGWGHTALEFAATLQYLKHPLRSLADHAAVYPRLRDELLGAYASRRALPAGIEQQVDAFIGARMIATLEWVLDDWPRPDHRAWGPGFLAECEQIFRTYAESPQRGA